MDSSADRVYKLECAVRAALKLRRSIFTLVPISRLLCVDPHVVDEFDKVMRELSTEKVQE